jgi:hypothetical protein
MSDLNPMVAHSARGTLDNIINVLTLMDTLLTIEDNGDDDAELPLTLGDIAGLKQLVSCLKNATEACYAQCSQEADSTEP